MLFAIPLDERSKKVLLVLCALFIILLLIFGGIYVLISKYMKKEAKKMDNYMYDLLRFQIIKNPHQFKKALYYHEERQLFNDAKWGWRFSLLLTGVAFALTFACFNADYEKFFTEAFNILPIIKWPTVGQINAALGENTLSGPDWLPASVFPSFISKNPDFSQPIMYFSLLYYSCMIICLFSLIRAILAYIARIHRGIKMSTKVFEKDLDKLDVYNLDNINDSINSPVPGQDANK